MFLNLEHPIPKLRGKDFSDGSRIKIGAAISYQQTGGNDHKGRPEQMYGVFATMLKEWLRRVSLQIAK